MAKTILLMIVVYVSCLLASLPVSLAEPENDSVIVRLAVHVLDIDQSKKLAEVKIFVFIDNFPYNRTKIDVWIVGTGSTIVSCKNTGTTRGNEWYYQGESNQTAWLLEGTGEIFPFDSYNLRFVIFHVPLIEDNFSLTSEAHKLQAFFSGPEAYYLNDLWFLENGLIPISERKPKEVSFSIQRSSNSQALAIIQFLIPIIACYYLLGATLVLDPKKQLAERLRINLSLFVFCPTFFIAIQNFLPYRSSLSFPEFFLTNLMISNTIYGIFSIIENKRSPTASQSSRDRLGKLDRWAVSLASAVFLLIYILTLYGKLTLLASLIFSYVVIPSYAYPMVLFITKEELQEKKLLYAIYLVTCLIPGIILILLQLLL